jgi:hypothetical protein
MKWALVIWLSNPGNFAISERFLTVDECLSKRQVVMSAFNQVDSKYNAVCRPIAPNGEKSNSNIVIQRYVIY